MYLNCHSWFSLRYGTLSPHDLVELASEQGAEAIALTDINNTSATFDFVTACRKKGIHPVVGIEFRREGKLLYIGIARNNKGFEELNRFLSWHNLSGTPLPVVAPVFENVYVIYPYPYDMESLRDHEWVGVRISDLNKVAVKKESQDRMLMLHSVTFRNKTGYNVHRLLRCIDNNILLSRLTADMQAGEGEVLLPVDRLVAAYSRFPRVILNTQKLFENCSIHFDSESKNRKMFTGTDAEDDRQLLHKLAMDGLLHRYGSTNRLARERVIKELEIINRLGFNAYFLITWDIIRYSTSRNFAYVGRGSGANSIVAYCLKITDVDPIELDLYFERFLNPHRTSPPDFDIDFSWKERDEITDYIFKRYGQQHCALLATYNTFRGRSIYRELGKVFGLPKAEIDILVDKHAPASQKTPDHITGLIYRYGKLLEHMPNYLSIHAGGVLISEDPIAAYTATDLPPKGFPITHFDMFVAEDMGYYKYDILSQRGLGHIKNAGEIILENTGRDIHIDTEIAKKDKLVEKHIEVGNTIGCFYIESPGMRMLLRKLRCSDYPTLVAASSIIRPGVAQSGMMQQYIERFHDPSKVSYLHPRMEELLEETYGVMVYQEDVIKVAHHFAGLDLGEADILRRAMSGKYRGRSEFLRIEKKFFDNCREKGYPDALSKEVWRQIESFSGYSFSKAHSASFAVESYHSLYLKAHYPREFMVAVINNLGGFYNTEFYVQEARRAGAVVNAPCINESDYQTNIKDRCLYIGFMHIKALEHKVVAAFLRERLAGGAFKSLQDFLARVEIALEQVNILIRINAFRFSGKSKKVLLWEACLHFAGRKKVKKNEELFVTQGKKFDLPHLDHHELDNAYDEVELLGFPLCFPFDLIVDKYRQLGVPADEMLNYTGKRISMVGYYVCVKDVMTVKRDNMAFAHFLDRTGKTFDTTHFPPQLRAYPFRGRGFYLLRGKIIDEFGFPSMEVDYMEKIPMKTVESEQGKKLLKPHQAELKAGSFT